jgi:cytochrome c-type biogenesis protein CcmH
MSSRGALAVSVVLMVATGACASDTPEARRAGTVREVESRLFAPCCWTQTLDVHPSPLADELRAEIEARVSRGEAAVSIEDDLVTRYGARVRAVPRDIGSRWLGAPFVLVAGLALLALWRIGRRLVRRGQERPSPAVATASTRHGHEAARQERLDDELLELD